MATPHFDAAAVRQARPAVPLAEIRARRSWPVTLMVLAVLAGLAGGVIGGVLSTGYLRRDAAHPAASQQATTETATTTDPSDSNAVPAPSVESSTTEQTSPAVAEAPPAEESKKTESDDAARLAEEDDSRDVQPEETQAELRAALGEWLAATNARDLGKQLSFYRPTMNAFYRRRNASLAEVRADRARVFEKADSINVRADAPIIRVSRDGQSATMRFLKRYAIAGGGEDRNGMVVQELRWQRIKGQWRIVSERDVKVVQ